MRNKRRNTRNRRKNTKRGGSQKMVQHITFFYIEERIKYLNEVLDNTDKYKLTTDIFIHTNDKAFKKEKLVSYKNGSLEIIWHDISGEDPHNLAWKCRSLLEQQKDMYDIFMYTEDDILVNNSTIEYWLKYKDLVLKHKYQLGFIRVETSKKNMVAINQFHKNPPDKIIDSDNNKYFVVPQPYWAFWIYDKNEFNKFVKGPDYQCCGVSGLVREYSAQGFRSGYVGALIPLLNNELPLECVVYHLTAHYLEKGLGVKFSNLLKFSNLVSK
jgi:hypothetical protein